MHIKWSFLENCSDVNKDLTLKTKAKAKARDLAFKAKANAENMDLKLFPQVLVAS